MTKFIKVHFYGEKKEFLINVGRIEAIWTDASGGTFLMTESVKRSNSGWHVQETYEEIRAMLYSDSRFRTLND